MLMMILSFWILYVIFSKLNVFIDSIYLFIIGFGVISSMVFINYSLLKQFNFVQSNNIKEYPIWVYILLISFFLFYIFILPLIIVNIINFSELMIFKKRIFLYNRNRT
jgi:hypothetical protein